MHILLDYRPALRERTGVGEYVHHLTAALLPLLGPSERVTLFSSSWKDRLPAGRLPPAAQRDVRIPVRLLNTLWHRLEWPPVEWFAGQADIAWSLHPLLMPARRAARVVTVYDLYFLDHPGDTVREIRRDYAALAGSHVRRADAVVTISEYTRSLIVQRFGVPPDRVTVCYPGAPEVTPRQAPPAGGPILHLGTIEPRKNVRPLIEAYAGLAGSGRALPPLIFAGRVGTPTDVLVAGLDAAVVRRIEFRGYVPDAERRRLLADAAMLVIPSKDEGFGLPAVEAMALGVPVVAAARGALPEVIGDAGLLVDGDDPAELSGAMAKLMDDPAERSRLAARGPVRAARFDWAASAVELLRLFRRLQRNWSRR